MRTHPSIVACVIAAASCSGPGAGPPDEPVETWLDTREAGEEPPALLSEIGIYLDIDAREPSPSAIVYDPVWPLWSNGLRKSRHLVLPEEETIAAEGTWDFPDGSLFFKTFEDDDGPVETRVMWKSPAEGWQWFAYVWNDEATDAERTDGRRSVDVEVTVDGDTFVHKVPNELDCRTCHEPDLNGVLGFEPLQLGGEVGSLEVFDAAPEPALVEHDDVATREILGWFIGNCTSCHNGSFEHDQSSFDLRPDVALDNIVGQETESSASIDGIRVVPGAPEESVLFLAVFGESDDPELKLMPPIGVQRRDAEAVERLRSWIEDL